MRNVITRTAIARLAGSLPLLFVLSASAITVNFDGELLDRPCQIDPGSLGQTVVFMERPVKDFQYSPGRSPTETFKIRLIDCDMTSIWKTVKLKFSGDRESNMTGQADYFLKVGGVNQGKLAVGLLDTDGVTPLKLGAVHNNSQGTPISGNALDLNFKAFVQATPEAIANKSVRPGEYTSIANFELFYE